MDAPDSDIEAIEVRLFLEGIHARYGYDLRDYASRSMRRRVLGALSAIGAPNLGELLHRVLHDREQFAEVLDHLTVRVSEHFRDPGFYRFFRNHVVPRLRTYPFLKIWHAGCATGEEAYTSAILLQEEGLYDRTQIYATDLSARALHQAKDGIYPAKTLPGFERNHAESGGTTPLRDHLTTAYDQIAIREGLRKNILFFQHDLVADHVFGEMHVVFCRNVLIYFGPELRRRVVGKLTQSLCPGGYLCLGSAERPPAPMAPLVALAGLEGLDDGDGKHRVYRYDP